MRNRAVFYPNYFTQVLGAADIVAAFADQVNDISCRFKIQRHSLLHTIQHPYHTNGGSRIDRAIGRLVIKAHIATRDRRVKFLTGFTHTLNSLYELVIYFGIIRVPEIETVGNGHRQAAAAYDI